MSLPKIIGFAGPAQSGKTSCALVAKRLFGYEPRAFADPIREAVQAIFRLTPDELNAAKLSNRVFRGSSMTMRQILQTLGTEWGREEINPDFWIQIQEQRNSTEPDLTRFVYHDVRFQNELDWIHAQGGRVIFVQRQMAGKLDAHASEALNMRGYDSILFNHYGLDDLEASVKHIIEAFAGIPPRGLPMEVDRFDPSG